jgi:hypothetical protein
VIQPEIEAADQGQTLIAIAWAIDSSNQLIASCAPVFGRRSTVSPGRERVVRMRIGMRHKFFRPGGVMPVTQPK